ncbi:MAG: hypothetical protein E6K20_08345 [Gammaproteobacteria bacterium]|nr:MAG: hypothetical protein E6K20_08345 [Gammaproteobacteria bacterium]
MSAAGRSPAPAAAAQRTASGSRAGRAAASRAAATGTAGTWDSPCGVRACTRRRSADARRRAGANQELRGDEPMSAPEPPAPRRAARRLPRANFVLHAASWLEAGLAMSNHQSAFYDFELADNNSFEQWSAEGGRDLLQRANRRWKSLLEAYQPPPPDPARDKALRE